MDDRELIARYVERREAGAFAELVGRHGPMVYAAARRQVGDAHLAEDVTQAVFIILERKAVQVRERGTVAGWLLNATHYAAREAMRRERRLKRRERVVMEQTPTVSSDEGEGAWGEIRPVLDEAMGRLGEADRDAVALRYLQSKTLAEVGAAMGVSEEAARKRVGRALERLRGILAGRGVRVEASVLGGLMSAHGVEVRPAAGAAGAGVAISKGAMALIQGAKIKTVVGVSVLMLLGVGAYLGSSYWRRPAVIPGPGPARVVGLQAGRGALGWNEGVQGKFATAGCVDGRGRVWVGGEEQGLWLYEGGVKWRHFTVADGLGEEGAFAVAADLAGRVWVGHLNHGVSVYDGTRWKNYDALTGPLGQHVYRIAVCPKGSPRGAGDVWIATEVGLARYSAAKDSWSYVTRAEGLPADQVGAMAFDGEGNLYAGTLCDGLLIAGPGDDYATWRRVRGAEGAPLTAAGGGLPGDTINAVATTADGSVFVGTNRGLARSTDHGNTWTFARGADWVDKVRGSIGGVPDGWSPGGRAALAEDYVASLAADDGGRLWVGYRTKGYQCLDPKTLTMVARGGGKGADYCAMILPVPDMAPLVGTRGFGLTQAEGAVVGAAGHTRGERRGGRGGDSYLLRLRRRQPRI